MVRTGKCNTCAHHLALLDETDELVCYCELEHGEKPGWFPGMHLDYCVFPPTQPGEVCPVYEPGEAVLAYERGLPLAPSQSLTIIISRGEVSDAVRRLAGAIRRDYRGKNPLLIGVLKGSFVFLADLVRALNIPLEVDFVQLSSYGRGRKESAGEVRVVREVGMPVEGRDVLVVEDIVDTGLSASLLLNYLSSKRPSSLKLCALLDKPSRRKVDVPIDYLGFTIPDKFVVGYGIDFDEKFRYLPDICVLEEK